MIDPQPLKSSRVSTWSFTWPEVYDLIAEHKIVNGRIACIGHCCTFVDYIKNSNSQPSSVNTSVVDGYGQSQHGVPAGELSSCVSANDVKNATRKGCKFNLTNINNDEFVCIRSLNHSGHHSMRLKKVIDSLSQTVDTDNERLYNDVDAVSAAMRMIAKEKTYDGGDSREIVAAETPKHLDSAYLCRKIGACKCHKEVQ